MNHDKLKEYSKIAAMVTVGLESLLKAQDLLAMRMCIECEIPVEMKAQMIEDMNKAIGIKRVEQI